MNERKEERQAGEERAGQEGLSPAVDRVEFASKTFQPHHHPNGLRTVESEKKVPHYPFSSCERWIRSSGLARFGILWVILAG